MLDLTDYSKFIWTVIQVPYEHRRKKEMWQYTVRFCPVLDAVRQVLEDPGLQKSLICCPERHYVWKLGTNKSMRVWSDVHTADDWWEIQVILLLVSHHMN